MRVCHGFTAVFDDPSLVSCAGLAPVLQLAERAGLQRLVAGHVHLAEPGGVNAHLKVPALVAGMVAGADSIDDMALLRHGGMSRLTSGVRAPSTLGTFLRTFSFSVAEAARREKVSEQSIGRWKADFLEAGKTALAGQVRALDPRR